MDTPIFDDLKEQVAGTRVSAWSHAGADPLADWNVPTIRKLALPPELFREWSELTHEWGAGSGLFRPAVVVSGRRRWAA